MDLILQARKLKNRKVKYVSQGHMVCQFQSKDLNLGISLLCQHY